jgi:hypothetical protein
VVLTSLLLVALTLLLAAHLVLVVVEVVKAHLLLVEVGLAELVAVMPVEVVRETYSNYT